MAEVVTIIGGGLAGSEAAWQVAKRGVKVRLFEMRPKTMTPAHKTGLLAELVCSNSLRSTEITTGAGLLKAEMKMLDSIIVRAGEENQVPAGATLAVDREKFARKITETLESHPNIEVIRERIDKIPEEGIVIIATGPLTHDVLAEDIKRLTGAEYLYFYDAVCPIVDADTIDWSKTFRGSRYGKGEGGYVNCPLTKEEYEAFVEALVNAEVHPLEPFEDLRLFEGCLPIEEMARRGKDTLRFGPLRPVGLVDPRTGKEPYAVVQLRPENREETMFELVGFQTRLKWPEQRRVFRMIPALREAEFVRYGVMHRSTFINGPMVLLPTYQVRKRRTLFFAGQITGVEGYVESAGSGLVAGINAARLAVGEEPLTFPKTTMLGAMAHHVSSADPKHFQPMNANFGLLPPPEKKVRKKVLKKRLMAERALKDLEEFIKAHRL
ncbi:MAG TPA: FADH(2)-oxidizing methylenetetrahydrofolate--tRNA-(uracil(54)-C(5))-methyltransferase TrmFO [Armatimonadetes bacterium]|nr:FADH(2)-oxidizing methylenetetrahydrofolate--tRNA-(uracil(54)-C(5))-methyltransferase TrmFO [Armatimonadota bacterium]